VCHTSNPDETGLIGLPSLHYLWPQLRQIDSTGCQARSLDSLISELVSAALSEEKNLWLLVDFFCAADFWTGASKALAHARVVVLRQTVKDIEGLEPAKATTHRMVDLGFVCCASLESNHPGVVHLVYSRGLAKDLEAAQTSNLALIQERYVHQRAKDEALEQRDQEAQAKVQALSQCETLAQEKAGLAAALEFEMQAKSDAQGERDAKAKIISEQGDEMEKLRAEVAVLRVDLEGAQLRAQTTENQNQNLYWRQDLLQNEMTKAEAQIDLIKDLLLRDPRL
jgi:hypothetical protein